MIMYCKKLDCILEHEKSSEYLIDSLIIRKLDIYLKEKVSLIERQRLSPLKFSRLMEVDQKTAVKTFVLGAKCNLFKPIAYFECSCGEGKFITSLTTPFECECEQIINPTINRDKISVYFTLLLPPEKCFEIENQVYQADLAQELFENFTIADLDDVVGTGTTDSIFSLKDERTKEMNKILGL